MLLTVLKITGRHTSLQPLSGSKILHVDGHSRVPEILIGSKKNFANLSKADLDIISQSAKDAVEFQKKKWAESEKVNEEKAKAAGCKITYLDAKKLLRNSRKPFNPSMVIIKSTQI